jgi:hypothetical protein
MCSAAKARIRLSQCSRYRTDCILIHPQLYRKRRSFIQINLHLGDREGKCGGGSRQVNEELNDMGAFRNLCFCLLINLVLDRGTEVG